MDSFDDTALALTKFGVGQPVPRMRPNGFTPSTPCARR